LEQVNDRSKLRLFTAVELPHRWKEELGAAAAQIGQAGADVKPVQPDSIHATLVFLGYQPPASLPRIDAALSVAARRIRPFRLALGRIGFFGQPHRLHVVWVGLDDPAAGMRALHGAVSEQLRAQGVQFDTKPLVPHITLARLRRPSDRGVSLRVHADLQSLHIATGLSFEVKEFVLMESQLARSGPQYTVVGRFPLLGSAQRAHSLEDPH